MERFSAFSVLCCVFALARVCGAQSPEPPEALSRFDPLLGNWKGKGTVLMSPGGEEIEWTAVSSVKTVADGHAIQEDVKIDMAEGPPTAIVFRSLYGWDRHAERFHRLSVSNMGFAGYGPVHWTEDGKLVITSTRVEQGSVNTEHAVSEFSDDTYSFRIERSANGGPFFTHVAGSFRKNDESFSAAATGASEALAPPAGEIRKLEPQLGTWKYEGKLRLEPGGPPMEISGRETIRSILGGHVHVSAVEGDELPGAPKAYRGQFYLSWDPAEKCYQAVSVDNFGNFGRTRGYLLSERKMVYTGSAVYMGVPQASRAVVTWGEDGKRIEVTSHRLAGAHPADKAFVGVYERVEE